MPSRRLHRTILLALAGMLAFILLQGCAARNMILIDQSGKGEFTSIREGLAEWEPGLPIVVRPGIYDEQMILQTKMNIKGSDPERVLVRFSGDGPALVGRDVSDVQVENINFEKSGKSKHSVVLLESTDLRLRQCRIRGGQVAGIETYRYGNLDVKGCRISDNRYAGVFFHHQARGQIENTIIENNARGVSVLQYPDGIPQKQTIYRDENGSGIVITKNEIMNNQVAGILADQGADVEITGNSISGNGLEENDPRSSDRTHGGVLSVNRSRITLADNEIMNNRVGAIFHTSGGGQVLRNRFHHNKRLGLRVEGPSRPEIYQNDFVENATGLQLRDGTESIVSDNRVMDNDENGIEVLEVARPTIEKNWVVKNKKVGLVIMRSAKPQIRYNFFVENGWHGLLAAQDAKPTVVNNTFYKNEKIGAWFLERSEGDFANNVIVGSKIGISIKRNLEFKPTLRGNCLWNNARTDYEGFVEIPAYNLQSDPLFTDPLNLDFSPEAGSPLIIKGPEGTTYIGAVEPLTTSGS